jgi:hypothetical protein
MNLKKLEILLTSEPSVDKNNRQNLILCAFFISIVIISVIIIAFFTKPIIYDQVIAKYRFNNGYPGISSGIVSHLLIGLYNFVAQPSGAAQNVHIKILAMILFMTSGFILAWSIFQNRFLTGLFMALLFLSRYPFLWLSTELIVASLLFLGLWAVIKNHHPVIISFFLALLCFSKPEMIIISMAFLVYYALRLRKKSMRSVGVLFISFIFFVSLIMAPGVIKRGTNYFSDANRSLFSFGQHYAALFARHQVSQSAPHPWDEYYKYLETNFKGADNMLEVCYKYPLKYFDFLLLSLGHGLLKGLALFHVLSIVLVMMVFWYFKKGFKPTPAEKFILISFIGYIPLILFSYPHIRYLARYYPLFIILILMYLKRVINAAEKENLFKSHMVLITIVILVIAVFINAYLFVHNLAAFESVKEFWFPD